MDNEQEENVVDLQQELIIDPDSDDNIYVYEDDEDDEDESDFDTSPLNYSQSFDLQDELSDTDTSEANTGSVFILLLKLLANPIEGWKEVRRKRLSVEYAQKNCFYPLIAIMALSHFAALFYSSRITVSELVIEAVTSFVGYFAGYFCIIILLKLFLPRDAEKRVDTTFGKVFVILNLSSLCLFFTAMELLPMLWPVLIFLPLWTVYVIYSGTRFFRFPENKTILCVGLMCLLIVGIPSLLEWGLYEILPTRG